jgi:hypothetical protein
MDSSIVDYNEGPPITGIAPPNLLIPMRKALLVLLLGIGLLNAIALFAAQPIDRDPANVAAILEQPAVIHWRGITLLEACRRITDSLRVPMLVDRRVDPRQVINIQVDGVPLQEALTGVARQAGSELSVLDSLCYLGPVGTANELPALLELSRNQVGDMPDAPRRMLSMKQGLRWQRLATPQQVFHALLQPLKIQINDLERVPHDVWNAGELPEDTVAAHLTVLLAGFDLTWRTEPSGEAIQILPIVRPVRFSRTYNWRNATPAQLQQIAGEIPMAEMRHFGGKVELNGTTNDHEKLTAILAKLPSSLRISDRPGRPTPERKLYSLRLKNQPVGAVLGELARQLGLELRVDEDSLRTENKSLDAWISVDVTQVTLDQLLETIGEPAGLSAKVADGELLVSPR